MNRCILYLTVLMLPGFACTKKKDETQSPLNSCIAVVPQGKLTKGASPAVFTYKTADGWVITIDFDNSIILQHETIRHYNLELWGMVMAGELSGNHENLLGKHIKDRLTNKRSIILPGGTKITLHVQDTYYFRLTAVSIYDGKDAHHINATCNTLVYSATDAAMTQKLDNEQADGETAALELSDSGLIFVNIYNETTPGNKVMERVLLGELFRDTPNRVNDHFDDPRLSHT